MAEFKLPADIDTERLVLGSIILDHPTHTAVFNLLASDDFSLEKHRRIYAALHEMDAAGMAIDRVTTATYLQSKSQLQSVDGISYLVSLDEGLPQFPNIEAYVETIREKSALRKIIYAARHLMNRCVSPGEKSSDLIALADRTLMEINYKPAETAELMNVKEVVDAAGGVDAFIDPKMGFGVKTPWLKLTEMTGGYRRGELFVIAGNPSHGKSAAAFQVAMEVAEQGLGALIFSLEMSRESLVRRMACKRARVDGAKLRAGYLNTEERSRLSFALYELSKWPLWIAEHGIGTVSAIRAALRRKKAKHEVFMIVIDYLQLLQGIGKKENRSTEIAEITRGLKLLAMDDDINVQLLSQLNRDNLKERRAPALHDLRESGSIEQDADAVAFVWRPEMLWRDREDLKGIAELCLWKQRNGPTGKIDLVWVNHLAAFEEKAAQNDE